MKKLKFTESLPELILKGEKTSTWRINDKRNITKDDELILCYVNGGEFARAIVLSTKITTFRELSKEDKIGHEVFKNNKEMYEIYSEYYNMQVNPETELKIIKFELRKK